MIDPVLVTRKMVLIGEDLATSAPYARLTVEEYVKEALNQVIVERLLERMIGRMIDINYHILTESGKPPPRDYYESFIQMGRLGVLPADFAQQLAPIAGLRNRLVHEYNDLDEQKVFEALQRAQAEVGRYLGHIRDFLEPAGTS